MYFIRKNAFILLLCSCGVENFPHGCCRALPSFDQQKKSQIPMVAGGACAEYGNGLNLQSQFTRPIEPSRPSLTTELTT